MPEAQSHPTVPVGVLTEKAPSTQTVTTRVEWALVSDKETRLGQLDREIEALNLLKGTSHFDPIEVEYLRTERGFVDMELFGEGKPGIVKARELVDRQRKEMDNLPPRSAPWEVVVEQ